MEQQRIPLDLILSDSSERISELKTEPILGFADQGNLTLKFNYELDNNPPGTFKSEKFNFKKGD